MHFILPIYQDLNDYFAVRTKTLSRIAIADIMDNSMLIRWYSKIFDSYLLVKDLKGFGYFESDFSHGYVQATFRFNKLALQVIKFQLELRGLNKRNTREISIIEATMKDDLKVK
tara:strand:+ start:531 stop:872 length:342 start_codon:yes stop_codon:yes gene_type:complete